MLDALPDTKKQHQNTQGNNSNIKKRFRKYRSSYTFKLNYYKIQETDITSQYQPGEPVDRGTDVPVLFRRGWRTKWVCHTESHAKYPGTRCNAAARTLPLGTSVSESDSSTTHTMLPIQSHTDQIFKCWCHFSESLDITNVLQVYANFCHSSSSFWNTSSTDSYISTA